MDKVTETKGDKVMLNKGKQPLDLADRTTEDLKAVLAEKDIRLAPQHRRAIKDELARREVLARRNFERLDLDAQDNA